MTLRSEKISGAVFNAFSKARSAGLKVLDQSREFAEGLLDLLLLVLFWWVEECKSEVAEETVGSAELVTHHVLLR